MVTTGGQGQGNYDEYGNPVAAEFASALAMQKPHKPIPVCFEWNVLEPVG